MESRTGPPRRTGEMEHRDGSILRFQNYKRYELFSPVNQPTNPSGKKEGIFFTIICTTLVVQIIVKKNTFFFA